MSGVVLAERLFVGGNTVPLLPFAGTVTEPKVLNVANDGVVDHSTTNGSDLKSLAPETKFRELMVPPRGNVTLNE